LRSRQKNVIYTDGRTHSDKRSFVLGIIYRRRTLDYYYLYTRASAACSLMRCTTTTGGNRIFSGNSSCRQPRKLSKYFYHIYAPVCARARARVIILGGWVMRIQYTHILRRSTVHSTLYNTSYISIRNLCENGLHCTCLCGYLPTLN